MVAAGNWKVGNLLPGYTSMKTQMTAMYSNFFFLIWIFYSSDL